MSGNIFTTSYLIANLLSIFMLVTAIRWPNVARILFSAIFLLAGIYNIQTAIRTPESYLYFGNTAVFRIYEDFIYGAFRNSITVIVVSIGIVQLLTAAAICGRTELMKAGLVTAMLFLLAIAPLGAGSAFPSTLILAFAAFILFLKAKFLGVHSIFHAPRHPLN
ncbi:hypothetical protein SAMN05444266_104154 [Chitinophaga jiangningensis]|uniref:Uncharacterized protein n=1 Tax=Chitinophaga jiangningensis TaxID=1419482 RepID=A0A1M7C1C7_9BACT|nr:hypothetical protein [Chitinophaga jiangningensis]SHL60963.1 hypothetical protein SAMN05444266_104154 [Chitinophaga jiangningensis]